MYVIPTPECSGRGEVQQHIVQLPSAPPRAGPAGPVPEGASEGNSGTGGAQRLWEVHALEPVDEELRRGYWNCREYYKSYIVFAIVVATAGRCAVWPCASSPTL